MRYINHLLLFVITLAACSNTSKESYSTIKIGDKMLRAEICTTNVQRNKVTNFLSTIKDDQCYLLCYPRERLQSFYAGSSSLRASVAFIGDSNEIGEIQDYSENGAFSIKPARFVLLIVKGWFEKNNVKDGDRVALPEEALKSEEFYTVTIKDAVLKVELATTRAAREQGLKFRKTLNKDEGMIFIYPGAETRKFWMKDTVVPLSLAYIKSDWTIASIHDLKPFDESGVPSTEPAQFVLEVAQGWFDQHNIKQGDKVSFSGKLDDISIDY